MLVVLFKYFNENYAGNYWIDAILLILPAILTASAGYIVNDICDIVTDKVNKPQKGTVGVIISKKEAWYWYVIITLFSFIISFALSVDYGIINCVISVLLFLYAFFLKGLPLIGNLLVAACSAAVVACCLLIAKIESQAGWLNFSGYIIFAFFISLIREIVKDLQDMAGDKVANYNTYPILVGEKGAKILIYVLLTFQMLAGSIYCIMAWGFSQKISAVIMAFITLSFFYFIQKLGKAKTRDDYGYTSNILKYVMLAGVINLLFT